MTIRRLEVVLGGAIIVWGCLVTVFTLFVPTFPKEEGSQQLVNWIQHGIDPLTVFLLVFALAIQVSLGISTVLNSHDVMFSRIGLWALTGLLAFFSLFTLLFIGILLLPSLLFAVIASVLSFTHEGQPRHLTTPQPE